MISSPATTTASSPNKDAQGYDKNYKKVGKGSGAAGVARRAFEERDGRHMQKKASQIPKESKLQSIPKIHRD